ncbi:MAG: bifunctional oligoribonuclease/PAP phosphatase NrnA [bacterium]|nr:bifunctional oligoribonuclease/PAP phosphatase NrnA [bacterium]
MATSKVPEALLSRIRQGDRFLVTSHVHPDGDAIGSEIGLSRILRQLGKGATIWNHDPTPQLYRSLVGSQRIHLGPEEPAGFPELFDAAIVLECPSPDRTGLEDALAKVPILNLDHHLVNEHYGEVNWVDSAAPAVGEMIYRLARAFNLEFDQATANALFLTLVTDTGGFRFSNTSPEAFEAAAALVREGASPETVAHWLYESRPESTLRLLGEVLGSLKLHTGGRIATVLLTEAMRERAAATAGDSEGLIDYPRSIAGVEAVALFRHLQDGGTKVSLRSRGSVDVEKIARRHGGGGHHNAAGFSLREDDQETAVRATVAELTEALGPAEDNGGQP